MLLPFLCFFLKNIIKKSHAVKVHLVCSAFCSECSLTKNIGFSLRTPAELSISSKSDDALCNAQYALKGTGRLCDQSTLRRIALAESWSADKCAEG
jgi:hypothetical protein